MVIGCLIDHREEIKDDGCVASVRRKMAQRVTDAANDPQLAAACE